MRKAKPYTKACACVLINGLCNFEDGIGAARLRANKCRARRLYENAWHCVAQAATQAKWHNKGTILFYASADCLPRERWTVLQRKHSIRVVEEIPAWTGKMGYSI